MKVTALLLSALVLAPACGRIDYDADGAANGADTTSPTSAVVGSKAPDFTLVDVDGNSHRLSDYTADGKVVVLEWFNPDCPITRTYHDSSRPTYSREISMASAYGTLTSMDALKDDGIVWLAVNSGHAGNKSGGAERNKKAQADYAVPYPILIDESGDVGRMYDAKTTPHMFVITPDGVLIYDGAIDDGASASPGTKNYVLEAVEAHVAGRTVSNAKTEPFGCSVKYGS